MYTTMQHVYTIIHIPYHILLYTKLYTIIYIQILEGIVAKDALQSKGIGTDNMTLMIVSFKKHT